MANVLTRAGRAIITNRIHGSGTEPIYLGFGTGSGTAANTDEALFAEVVSQGRVTGTGSQQTTTTTNDTWQAQGTLTASGSLAITNAGCFDDSHSPAQTTLSAAISSTGATSMTVTSASGFPGSGNYDIQIDSEVLTVTGGQGTTTWTVTRGVNGSTAATHSNGATVTAAQVSAGGGNMFAKGDFSVVNLNSGDSLQLTVQAQFS